MPMTVKVESAISKGRAFSFLGSPKLFQCEHGATCNDARNRTAISRFLF
jgi:hypothetical protein